MIHLFTAYLLCLLCFTPISLAQETPQKQVVVQHVLLNPNTHVYHARRCPHAKRCKKHCVLIHLPDVQHYNALPCKTCGGSRK